tara:strand:+ start:50 stop:220 length:171 start_codon:yes stop_codon:yes gene_type:complete
MRKKHAPSQVAFLSMCGYEATPQEYNIMKSRRLRNISCKKCLELLEARNILNDMEI